MEVAVTNDGTAFVANQVSGTVSVIPSGANIVSRTIQVSSTPGKTDNPHGIAAGPDGTIYVTNISSNEVAVIKPGADTVAYRIPVSGGPQEAAVGQDGTLYVTTVESRVLSVIPPGATAVGSSIPTDSNSGHLAVAPDGTVVVASPGNGTGNGSVSRYVPTAAGAAPSAASKPASAITQPQQAEPVAAGTPSAGGIASPWNTMTVIAGGAATAAIAVAVLLVALGRRKRSALRDGGKPRSAT